MGKVRFLPRTWSSDPKSSTAFEEKEDDHDGNDILCVLVVVVAAMRMGIKMKEESVRTFATTLIP